MVRRRLAWACLLALGLGCLAACSSNTTRVGGVISDTNVKLSPSFGVPLEKVIFWGAYVGAAYLILDPLAPNWEIEQAPMGEGLVHVSLRMKRVQVGGAGEARQLFHRRARALVQYGGFEGYEVREYEEGLNSSILGSQRTASGVIHLLGKGEDPALGQPGSGTAAPARMTSESATNPRS